MKYAVRHSTFCATSPPITAQSFRQNFGDERDAAAEFAGQAETGDETPHGVSLDGMHKTIGNIGDGIKQNGTEEQRDAAHAVAKDAEENAAEQHPEHLQIEEQNTVAHQKFTGKTHGFEARNPQDGEQDQIINVHKIAERADDDRRLKKFAQNGFIGFHLAISRILFF
jgi:hypothetical protein